MVTEEQLRDTKLALNYYARLTNPPAVREHLNLGEKLFLLAVGTYNRSENPWIGSKELCRTFGYAPSSATEILNGLETKELLTRRQDPSDKRKHILVLTEKGSREYNGLAETLSEMAKNYPIDRAL
jgi:DNA-binding MarR family transcriptional regulator